MSTESFRIYPFELSSLSPLLMHHDNVSWDDQMQEWLNVPENKKGTKAGDDRTPAFKWIGYLYHDGDHVALAQTNIMRALVEAASLLQVPGQGKKTYKEFIASRVQILSEYPVFTVHDKQIPFGPINNLQAEPQFSKHAAAVKDMGFLLDVRRARVGTSGKHVRVRPRFHQWRISGELSVDDDLLTAEVLQQIFTLAGRRKGLCDWRPGGRTPGPYGMFRAKLGEMRRMQDEQ